MKSMGNYFSKTEIVLWSVSILFITTSFFVFDRESYLTLAVYLTFRRCPAFALAYAANDIVLIVLWIMASMHDRKYICVVVCFIAFLANDLYGYMSWQRMKQRQAA